MYTCIIYLNLFMEDIILEEERYPGLLERVKAIMADTIAIIIFMMLVTFVFSFFTNVPDNVRMYTFIFIFVLYDPLFTSLFGRTLGHMMNNIVVRRENEPTKNINFIQALIRYAFKAFLGWISLLTVTGNEKRKAIHDFVVGSVVMFYKKD